MIGMGYYNTFEAVLVTLFFTGPIDAMLLGVGCTKPGSKWIIPLTIIGYVFGAVTPWIIWWRDRRMETHAFINH